MRGDVFCRDACAATDASMGNGPIPLSWDGDLVQGGALTINPHMWNGPRCKVQFRRFHHTGTVRSYVRPLYAAHRPLASMRFAKQMA